MNRHSFSRSPFLVVCVAVIFSVLSSWFGWLSGVDKIYYDFMLREHSLEYPDDVVIIAIDETSIDRIGAWPWSRSIHAQLLEHLSSVDAVVFDVIFAEPQAHHIGDQVKALDSDRRFSKAIAINKKVILPVFIEEQQFRGMLQEALPLPLFAEGAASLGHVQHDYDADGITRGFFMRKGLGGPYWPHLSLAVANYLGEIDSLAAEKNVDNLGSPYKVYQQDYKKIRFVGPPNTVYRLSYADILDGLIPVSQLDNKRVFVGSSAKGLGDEMPTPVGLMSGVEFYVNAYQAIREDGFVRELPLIYKTITNVIIVLSVCTLLTRFSPLGFFLGTFVFGFFWVVGIGLLFITTSLWFDPSPCLFSVALFYPMWSWRRIEIALKFLRDELEILKSGFLHKNITFLQLQQQLDCLKEIGLFKKTVLVEGNDGLFWPAFSGGDEKITTCFSADGKNYRLDVELIADKGCDSLSILSSLLADFLPSKTQSTNSYELVEQTIEEIYVARAVAERMQQRMDKSMAGLQDAVLLADFSGRVVFSNIRCEQLFCPDLVGQSVLVLKKYIDAYIWPSLLRELMAERQQIYQELDAPDEKRLLCQATMIGGGEHYPGTLLFVFTDVTQLRALEKSKNEALAFLSHDMRSPIVSQLSMIENYKIKHQCNNEPHFEIIDSLALFAEKSLQYAEDFLQLSRAENLAHEQFQLVDMHGVVDGAYAQMDVLGREKNIEIMVDRALADCWIDGDAYLLERAIMNLLTNAIQYSPSSGQIKIQIYLDVDVHIVVKDQGKGIDPAMLPHLFEPYFRSTNDPANAVSEPVNLKARSGNYGLGLSFVHTVVKRHGGRVKVLSKPGTGTTFKLSFPCADEFDH